jgi:ParB-like chromosome segregation protein Spo0J
MSLVVHPYADAFPMMSDDALDALADDIKANGLRHPIIRDKDGMAGRRPEPARRV